MKKLNLLIGTNFNLIQASYTNPPLQKMYQVIWTNLKKTQKVLHLKFLSTPVLDKNCKDKNIQLKFTQSPYGKKISRSLNGSAKKIKNKWEYNIFYQANKKRFQIKGQFQWDKKWPKIQEITLAL